MKPRSKKKIVRKKRVLSSYFGEAANLAFYSVGNGFKDTSSQYLNRLKPDFCRQQYYAARSQAQATKPWNPRYGEEEIVGVNGNRAHFNPLLHFKVQGSNLPFLTMPRYYANKSVWYMWDYLRLDQAPVMVADSERVAQVAKTMTPGSDSNFSARAFWSMRPKFEGDVSIINSIFELKDFKDVLKPLKALRNLRSVVTSKSFDRYSAEFRRLAYQNNIHASINRHGIANYSDLTPSVLNTLARDVSGTSATALLTMNLAIKPTIADALAILAQCAKSAVEAQNIFAQYGQLGTTSHFSEKTLDHNSTQGTGINNFINTGTCFKTKRTATARFWYNYVPRSKNEALARYWGLTGSVEALWNMLPLSFVIDYVYTVGKALKYMDRDANVTNLTTEYCESVKIESFNGYMVRQDPDMRALVIDGKYIYNSSFNLHLVSGVSCTRYHRLPMEPYKGPALPKVKLPSKMQTANILALARLFFF